MIEKIGFGLLLPLQLAHQDLYLGFDDLPNVQRELHQENRREVVLGMAVTVMFYASKSNQFMHEHDLNQRANETESTKEIFLENVAVLIVLYRFVIFVISEILRHFII
jgi:hypothetical protein